MQNTAAVTAVTSSEKSPLDVQENVTFDSQYAVDQTGEAYIEDATPVIDRKAERRLVRKQDIIILPLLGLGYMMGVLVGTNILPRTFDSDSSMTCRIEAISATPVLWVSRRI